VSGYNAGNGLYSGVNSTQIIMSSINTSVTSVIPIKSYPINSGALISFITTPNSKSYIVTSSNGITSTGTSSPIRLTGLTNGTSYTFTMKTVNLQGDLSPESISNSITADIPFTITTGGFSSASNTLKNDNISFSITVPSQANGMKLKRIQFFGAGVQNGINIKIYLNGSQIGGEAWPFTTTYGLYTLDTIENFTCPGVSTATPFNNWTNYTLNTNDVIIVGMSSLYYAYHIRYGYDSTTGSVAYNAEFYK